ncbi:MAG TPA: hypothetical protein VIL49_08000 [Capillimicrobium sp.]|jgi:hypothetical protein
MLLRAPTAGLFGALAWVRRRHRALHPVGAAFEAEVDLGPTAPEPLGPGRTVPGIARVSRGAGLPQPLPDVQGIALKLPSLHGPGRDQDLLFATAWARHLLRPVLRDDSVELSTILPYALPGGEQLVFGLIPCGDGRYDLVSAPVGGRWREPWGEVRLGRRLPQTVAEELRFHPYTSAPDLRPAGPLNALRVPAYRASQSVRR